MSLSFCRPRRGQSLARLSFIALAISLIGPAAHAQGVATEQQLAPVVITGIALRSGLALNLPSNSASKTAEELRQQNLINAEDALNLMPSTSLRKRYVGDRNAMIGGRSFGTLQPGRGLAYVDGYLISNFLGRFDGPRWHMVTPEAIARVDLLYGPFSAIYPGNSIGTTVAITERVPQRFEASARVSAHSQRFSLYGLTGTFSGGQLSAYAGTRLDSGLAISLSVNHQDTHGQPMNYFSVLADAKTGQFPKVSGSATPVTGIVYDLDPKGQKRALFGASGGAMDHTVQDAAKLKLHYAFSPEWVASSSLGLWTNQTENRNQSSLKDAQGRTVWSGRVTDGVNTFSIPDSAFAPSNRDELHRHAGVTVKSQHKTGWNASLVASSYTIAKDIARQAQLPQDKADQGGPGNPGTWTRRDGTGWDTLELQAAYTPTADDWGGGLHRPVLGLHRNRYVLNSPTRASSQWTSQEGALTQAYEGRTEVWAAYAQDSWRLQPQLTLTLGWREEHFKTTDGLQTLQVKTCTAAPGVSCEADGTGSTGSTGSWLRRLRYESRVLRSSSPKLSLAWQRDEDTVLKASFGRGTRFPNVEELYNGTFTASSQTQSDPNLAPERSDALELSLERQWDQHQLRVSLFHDDVRDAILRQSDATVTPSVTRVSNVDRVRTYGLEAVWQAQDLLLPGLNLDLNAAWAHAKVMANRRDPQSVGMWWLRVPKLRANALFSYRPDALWMGSITLRHSGRAYNDSYNLDTNPNTYGGVSSFTMLDLRLSRKFGPHLELALGLNNATDQKAYQAHPYPGRTWLLELRARH